MKLLADTCIGKPLCDALADLLAFHHAKPHFKHITEYFRADTADDVWLNEIAADNWIVISADRGKRYGGPKLPRICSELRITHVLMGASLHQAKQFEKARAIVAVFPQILEAFDQPKGRRYLLRAYPPLSYRLEERS